MNMLKFSKTVLDKVSFDEKLFEKELQKAIDRLMSDEVEELRAWSYNHFPQFAPILHRCFYGSFSSNHEHLANVSLMNAH